MDILFGHTSTYMRTTRALVVLILQFPECSAGVLVRQPGQDFHWRMLLLLCRSKSNCCCSICKGFIIWWGHLNQKAANNSEKMQSTFLYMTFILEYLNLKLNFACVQYEVHISFYIKRFAVFFFNKIKISKTLNSLTPLCACVCYHCQRV